MRPNDRTLTVDIIVPLYNEARGVQAFHESLSRVTADLAIDVTFYYVNDGSRDETGALLDTIAGADRRVVVIELSRNFGHQAALSAGLDASTGDVVITMDGDGQHPAEIIPDMLRLSESGYDVVLTQRMEFAQAWTKRSLSRAFYWFLSRVSATAIVAGSADYRLMARPVVEALKRMPEYHRFLRGMVAWLGYRTIIIPYAEKPRAAGTSKYSLGKMLSLAMDATFSFSLVPLRIGIVLGLCFLILAAAEVGYVLHFWAVGRQHTLAPGWSSLMFMILLVGGVLLIVTGFVGIYVGYIFQEVKRRPVYVIRDRHGAGGANPGSAGR
jgi:dolichol-phosphate mannosyltransferase